MTLQEAYLRAVFTINGPNRSQGQGKLRHGSTSITEKPYQPKKCNSILKKPTLNSKVKFPILTQSIQTTLSLSYQEPLPCRHKRIAKSGGRRCFQIRGNGCCGWIGKLWAKDAWLNSDFKSTCGGLGAVIHKIKPPNRGIRHTPKLAFNFCRGVEEREGNSLPPGDVCLSIPSQIDKQLHH